MSKILGMPTEELELLDEAELANLKKMIGLHIKPEAEEDEENPAAIQIEEVQEGYQPVIEANSSDPIKRGIAAYATYIGAKMDEFNN